MRDQDMLDIFIIGGGIIGCGIARDAAGRGLSVSLAEMKDLAWATSSASTKLFHGGLRYLEYFELRLVREALIERETLLRAMPHISWPMRFVLPLHKDMRFDNTTPTSRLLSRIMPWMKGRRPNWLIRLGLFMYDHLGGRKILPGTHSLDLTRDPAGAALQDKFSKAFEYSDCWVEDSRLVVLNARDAAARGAEILTRTEVIQAERRDGHWDITLKHVETGEVTTRQARMLVNAGGPWVADIISGRLGLNSGEAVRLVRGSHIVTKRLYDHDKCYFFQGSDGRIIFAIPYEQDFTLIGTTDAEHADADTAPTCTDAERDYLLSFANQYFERSLTAEDVVWRYSGVRPLYDDGAASASAATRDYVLPMEQTGAPVLNIFGGKITTYRRLAESALEKIDEGLGQTTAKWTAGVPLPGGDFPVDGFDQQVEALKAAHPYLDPNRAHRLIRAYGTDAMQLLGDATSEADLGKDFGGDLFEAEIRWLITQEYAVTAEDVVWRRTKRGLRMSASEIGALDRWMAAARSEQVSAAE